MYKLTIPPDSSIDCHDCLWYSILKYYNYNYKLYNIKYLYMDYYSVKSHQLCFKGKGGVYKNILKQLYGIKVKYITKKNGFDIDNIIRRRLAYAPIGIFIDPYYLPWSPFYNTEHHNHSLLIIDIDFNNNKYMCFDVHYNKKGYILVDKELINKHFFKCFTFKLNKKKIKINEVLKKLNRYVNTININNYKQTELYNAIKSCDINLLFHNKIEVSYSLINLNRIALDRQNFGVFIKSLWNEENSLLKLIIKSSKTFLILKALLTKYALTKKLNDDYLKQTITEIFILDSEIVQALKTLLRRVAK